MDNSYHFEQKELIEERQSSAFADLKRKNEKEKLKEVPTKKKKWYELDEDEESKEEKRPIKDVKDVLSPSKLRAKQLKERMDKESIKLFGKSSTELDKDPAVVLQVTLYA